MRGRTSKGLGLTIGRLVAVGLMGLLLLGCRSNPDALALEGCVTGCPQEPGAPERITSAAQPQKTTLPPEFCSRGEIPRYAPRGEVYVGGIVLAGPGFGGGAEFGQVFARSPAVTWSFEGAAAWADLSATPFGGNEDQGGSWGQIRGGVKASFNPCGRGHPTARAGLLWFRATQDAEFIDGPGDYFGGYLGLGYEWDVTRWFTTGPEVTVLLAAQEKSVSIVAVPQIQWHFIFNL